MAAVAIAVLAAATAYAVFRIASVLGGAPASVWAFTALLLVGESFFLLHGFGFSANVLRGLRHRAPEGPSPADLPPVAVFVSSYNEPVELVEGTLRAAMSVDYPRKAVYLLDDSTEPETVDRLREVCARLGVAFLHRTTRRGYKAGALNDALRATSEPLIAVLDADQRPDPDFLRANVPRLLAYPEAAFVQTPQVYTNVGESLVAFASEVQQTSFYDLVCVGKDAGNALFYLGTNVILRRIAIEDAGGFAEDSVTEDVATSYRMHKRGWRSLYHPSLSVRGVGPPNLIAYYNQQYRWAYGNLRLFPEFLRDVRPGSGLRRAQRFEYFLTVSWWLQGWANLALLLLPPAFFLFGVRVLGVDAWAYAAAMVPFLVLSTWLNALALRSRGYSARGVALGQSLFLASFPVYIKAFLDALRGKRVPFRVTAKDAGLVYVPFRTLLPQIALVAYTVVGIAAGLWLLIMEPVLTLTLLLGIVLLVMAAWELLTRARELVPLRIAQQRAAWRSFQLEVAVVLAATVAFLLGLNLVDVASRTPAVLDYFASQWSLVASRATEAPAILFNLFWSAYNLLFLYGIFLFRVGTR